MNLVMALMTMTLIVAMGCGIDQDGSYQKAAPAAAASAQGGTGGTQIGRYQTEAVRLGVNRPLFLLTDTATGQVFQRSILGAQTFRPVTEEAAPGAHLETPIAGRYDVKVVPGRGGSAILRLDSVTGATWSLQLGGTQRTWYVIPSELSQGDDKPESFRAAPEAASTPHEPRAAAAGHQAPSTALTPARLPPIEAMLEVLTEPGFEEELAIWTGSHLASIYPAEAAELLTGQLAEGNPKVMVSIIEALEFDEGGRVQTALEAVKGHSDEAVAAAATSKLSAPN
ncbi:MAG: hypothetical protein ACI9QQ_000224 [Myxococcota bacterium]|jgi:hypothetical protein